MGQQTRILLVEDDALNRQLLSEYLSILNYQVLSLSGGVNFFQALAEFQPQLILLDLKLPDIDGYTLLQQLEQTPQWQDIPIIVLSALAFKVDRQRAMTLGVKRYLVKPVNLNDLRRAIQEELGDYPS